MPKEGKSLFQSLGMTGKPLFDMNSDGKDGKNLFQALGINGKPLFGGSPEGVDPMSFQGIMGNPAMRFGMGMLKRANDGGGFGQHLAGAVGDIGEGMEQDEARAARRAQMDMQNKMNALALEQLQGMNPSNGAPPQPGAQVPGAPSMATGRPQALVPRNPNSAWLDPRYGYSGGMRRNA